MIINNRINEARSINLGSGKSAYQYGGKYYIKSGDTKKEISSDQYQKLLSRGNTTKSNTKSSSNTNPSNNFKQKMADKGMKLVNSDNGKGVDLSKYIDDDSETYDNLSKLADINDDKYLRMAEPKESNGHAKIVNLYDISLPSFDDTDEYLTKELGAETTDTFEYKGNRSKKYKLKNGDSIKLEQDAGRTPSIRYRIN